MFGRPKHEYTRALMSAGRHRGRTLMRTPIGGVLLDVRHVSRRYREPAKRFAPGKEVVGLDDLSLSLRTGESLALMGPAGAGKSTLLRIIAGLDRAAGGELEFDHAIYHGSDLPPRLRRDITLVTSDPDRAFNPRLTVGESIAEPLRLEALRPMEELSARIVEALTAVGLAPDVLARHPEAFSAGERQRLAIARALVTRPRLMLLDEPVRALDAWSRGHVLVLLNRMRADFGVTFLLATQDLEVARIVADRVAVMEKGKVVEVGTPAQLLETPQHAITQQLVAAALPEVAIVPLF
jgi:peptide/nickel transport system ATP-binding protein